MNNRDLEGGCVVALAFLALASIAAYLDYQYHLSIAKEAIRQTQQESQK